MSRKLLHLLSLTFPAGFILLGRETGLIAMGLLSFIALVLEFLRSRNQWVFRLLDDHLGFMMRASERDVLNGRMVINGATWVTLSFTILAAIFPEPIAVISFSSFMIGDAMAALIGRKWGKTPWARAGCTVEGSLAFLISAVIVAFAIGYAPSPASLYAVPAIALLQGVLVSAALEAAPIPLNDNLMAPLGGALCMFAVMALL